MYAGTIVYDDSDADQIETIAPTQMHRDVDLAITAADAEASYPPRLIARAGMVGEGKNLWPNVEIHELGDLYTTLYDNIVADADTGHGRNGFYFGASGEHSLYDVGKAIGTALVALGKSESAEPTEFTQAELDKYFGGSPYLGSNSRCRATRSLALAGSP
ncbi:hypothetical protein B0H13DRAFT_2007783 [Mycena leptocephala]|nr:hypothetical protein B0H13DRAFT_2007783 [Mycena leptocephala]